ncbi:hypothetical protein K9M74_02525 [Candidatus Woesearchaeota archaeon]|nr:hypothetical protein [Candidatus Woesearchaeota archaeon]
MKQKAQSEIIGLVIIVIIISIVLLFYLSSSINAADSSKKRLFTQYTNNALQASFIKAFIDTSLCGTTIDSLIYDCATTRTIRCHGMNSCAAINDTLYNITNQTLDEWGYIYDFRIDFPSTSAKDITAGQGLCTAETVGRSPISPYSIPLYPWTGAVRLELGICN